MSPVVAVLLAFVLAQQRVEVDFGSTHDARVKLLRHPIARVRARAALLLAHAPVDEAIAGLLVALGDSAPQVRIAAAGSLARLADERAVPSLATRLGSERSPAVVSALLYAIARCGGPYLAHRVVAFLEFPDRRVRVAAARALGRIGGAGQRDALWSALRYAPDDPTFSIRSSILNAFVELGWKEDVGRAITELEESGAHRHWISRAAICAAVGGVGLEDRVDWLEQLLHDEDDPRVLAAGIGSLAKLGRMELVRARLGHAEPEVRRAALVALQENGDETVVARALEMVESDPDLAVRFEAALVLHHAGHPTADRYLVDALSSRNALFWITALGILEKKYGRSFGRDVRSWTGFLDSRDG